MIGQSGARMRRSLHGRRCSDRVVISSLSLSLAVCLLSLVTEVTTRRIGRFYTLDRMRAIMRTRNDARDSREEQSQPIRTDNK